MKLSTPYDLPFAVTVPTAGMLVRGEGFDLSIGMRQRLTQDTLDAVEGVVTSWGVLAGLGAMGGDHLAAANSRVADWSGAMPAGHGLSVTLSGVRVDDRAAVMLVHLLRSEWDDHRFDRVELRPVSNPSATQRLAYEPDGAAPYPGMDRSAAFRCGVGRELMGDVRVSVRFAAPLNDEQRAVVETALVTWSAVAGGGSYAIAPDHPLEAIVVAEQSLQWVDEEATWGLSKVRLHPGAFDGLFNVVSSLDQQGLSVAELTID